MIMAGKVKLNNRVEWVRRAAALLLPLTLVFSGSSIAQVLNDSVGGLGLGAGGIASGTPVITNTPALSATKAEGALYRQKNAALAEKQPAAKEKQSAAKEKQSEQRNRQFVTEESPPTEFQDFVAQSIGRKLPIYGYSLFTDMPDTFAPVENIPVTPDYLIGPGDEIVIKAWGQVDIDFHAVVNRNGAIDLPKVGNINVAGIPYQQLQGYLKNSIGRIFRNFDLNVTLGKLRSIQVYVVGQANYPGVYTVSSLSTLVNTLFSSGGPSVKGSMRQIQVKRNNKTITTFDLYDLIIKGDKSKDVKLLPGDVIYIPPVGRQVAITGSVNDSAIYEIKENANFSDLLELAGGLTSLAATQKASVEQILDRKLRKVEELQFDEAGLAYKLHDGDIVTIFPISQRFDNAVKLQGNVASPIRHVWQKGMRVSDLLGGKGALIPSAYWAKQNKGSLNGSYSKKEVNWDYAVIQRLDQETLTTRLFAFNLGKAIQGDPVENELLQPGDVVTIYAADEELPKTENDVALNGSIFIPSKKRFVWREGMHIRNIIPDAKWLIDYYGYWQRVPTKKPLEAGPVAEINWQYASIVRQQPRDLRRTMITFDLGKAVLENDSSNNLALLPGDEISIYTSNEVQVSTENKRRYVRLEGEFIRGGMYEVLPGETLRQLVARAGGLSATAYLFGAEFNRDSAREIQQKRLQAMADRMEADINRNLAAKQKTALTAEDANNAQIQAEAQAAMVQKLRSASPTGRVVLEIPAQDAGAKDIPDITLEDGDRFMVPSRPSTVNVMGMVYNENTFIYRPGKYVSDYLNQAGGPTRDADTSRIYLLRADGSVSNPKSNFALGGFSSNFGFSSSEELMPGDTVVVPELLDKFAFTKELKDWSQILYQFALGVAGIKALNL